MKTFLFSFFILACVTAYSQDSIAYPTDSTKSASEQEGFDFYVVKSGDLFLSVDSEETQIDALDPGWIESITLYKGADAKLKYGDKAKDGVIIIDLTKDGFKKLPKAVRDKFRKLTPN